MGDEKAGGDGLSLSALWPYPGIFTWEVGMGVAKKIVGVLLFLLVVVALRAGLKLYFDSKTETAETERVEARQDRFAQAVAEMDAFIAKGQWVEAKARHEEASGLQPGAPGLSEKGAQIDGELARIAEEQRRATVAEGMAEAEAVVGSKEKCRTAAEVAKTWEKLRQAKEGDPEIERAREIAAKLERCRAEAFKALEDYFEDAYAKRREELADRLETAWLREGMDIGTRLSGKNKENLTLTWVLFGRPMVFKLANDTDLLQQLTAAGFKKVVFSTGFGESYSYDLEPGDVAKSAAQTEFARLLLFDHPIKL